MIQCFRELCAAGLEGWELHLAGSFRPDIAADAEYLDGLEREAERLPVRFHVNAALDEIRRLYGEASLYWHATGHGVDEEAHPQHLEHFGMAVVEAMAAEAIPLVIRRGGPVEIVAEGETGFFWDEPVDLVRRTRELAMSTAASLERFRASGREAAKRFSKQRFAGEVRNLALELAGD
jgi:glycosyltransferase involved in cell wall biosynthesis